MSLILKKNNDKKNTISRSIIDRLTGEKSKHILIHHLIPITLFAVISIFIFRNLIGTGDVIFNGDLRKPPDLEKFFQWFYPMWREYESVTAVHRVPALIFYSPFFAIGFLFNMNSTDMLVMIFIFIEALTGISMYYATRYMLKRTYPNQEHKIILSSIFAGFAYMWSSYIFFQILHPLIRVAFAFAPLILLFLIMGLEKKQAKYIIYASFLWCVICADIHWVVYGGVLLISFIIFNFIVEVFSSTETKKVTALKKGVTSHLKYFIILVGTFLGYAAYWFIPGYLMGGTSRHGGAVPSHDYLDLHYSRATVLDIITRQGEHFAEDELLGTSIEFLNSQVMQNVIIVFSFSIFIIGILALLLKPKNRYVLFFSIFLIISLFLSTLVNLAPEFGYWLITDAPLHEWYGWAIRTPKISQFVIFSLCFLSAFTVMELLIRIENLKFKNINWRKSITYITIAILFTSIILPNWPLATGDVNEFVMPTDLPDEFSQTNSWLEEQEDEFKVLWIPRYSSKDVVWNEGRRTIMDVAGLTSARPTYIFNSGHIQPNLYGIYFLSSTVEPYPYSFLYNNVTNDLGKILTPLGIKYILYHDDNAILPDQSNMLLENLKDQSDFKLVQKFGFIYVFENTYMSDLGHPQFFTPRNNYLCTGGLTSLATLNSLPDFDPRIDNIIFANQENFDFDNLNNIVDGVIITKTGGLSEIAFTFAEDDYLIKPYDHCNNFLPYTVWSKSKIQEITGIRAQRKGSLTEWDWDYNQGVIFTWSEGSIQPENKFSETDRIKYYNFEKGIENFRVVTTDMTIYQSQYSVEGQYGLKGFINRGVKQKLQITVSEPIEVPKGDSEYRVSFNFAVENMNNAQVILKYFDVQENFLGQSVLVLESGNLKYTKIEDDIIFPEDTKYCQLQLEAYQNYISDSAWWMDEFKIYNLEHQKILTDLKMDFEVDETQIYDIFVRCLKSENGGNFNLIVNDKLVYYIDTLDNINAFQWVYLDSILLNKGSQTAIIQNEYGFNAINLIAVVPENKMSDYYEQTDEFLTDKELIYCFEPEVTFDYYNASSSRKYGSEASRGEVLSFSENAEAWSEFEVFKTGNYSLALKAAIENPYDNISLVVNNNTYVVESDGSKEFKWVNFDNIHLDSGPQLFHLTTPEPKKVIASFSFDIGWNHTNAAPKLWSAPRKEYKVTLDPDNKTDGKYSVILTTDTTDPKTWSRMNSEEFFIKPNSFYEVKIDIKIDNVNNGQVRIVGYNTSTQRWEFLKYVATGLKGTKNWTEYNTTFFLPTNISRLYFVLNAGPVLDPNTGNATTWFDNLKLRRVTEERINEIDTFILYSNENNESLHEIFQPHEETTIIKVKKIDSTKYEVKISTTKPFVLGLAEAYDKHWIAYGKGIGKIDSIPIYGMLNGFFIDRKGNFTVIIEFEPQQWFYAGLGITGLTMIGTLAFLIWVDRKSWSARFKKLIPSKLVTKKVSD